MDDKIISEDITGLVLAGGASSRMGWEDKSWLTYLGQPMIQRVLSRLIPQVKEVLISANRHQEQYASLGFNVIEDDKSFASAGPLAGIAKGLASCMTNWLLVVTCDAPHIPLKLAKRLAFAVSKSEQPVTVAYPHDGERTQHVFMLVNKTCLPSMVASLSQGQHSVLNWVESQASIAVDFSDRADAFMNINTPDDLHA